MTNLCFDKNDLIQSNYIHAFQNKYWNNEIRTKDLLQLYLFVIIYDLLT